MSFPRGLFLPLFLISLECNHAETFFGPTSPANKLLIASNETAIISSVVSSGTIACDLSVSNLLYTAHLASSGTTRMAIAGPAELRVSLPCAIYFKRVQNLSVRTICLAGNDTTNGFAVSVPSGKTVEFFASLNPDVTPNVYLSKAGFGSNLVQIVAGQRLEGPADVRFYNTISGNAAVFSCWFVEDVFQNPGLLFPSLSQTPEILLEKSDNLNRWTPTGIVDPSIGSNAYYRLRILY